MQSTGSPKPRLALRSPWASDKSARNQGRPRSRVCFLVLWSIDGIPFWPQPGCRPGGVTIQMSAENRLNNLKPIKICLLFSCTLSYTLLEDQVFLPARPSSTVRRRFTSIPTPILSKPRGSLVRSGQWDVDKSFQRTMTILCSKPFLRDLGHGHRSSPPWEQTSLNHDHMCSNPFGR